MFKFKLPRPARARRRPGPLPGPPRPRQPIMTTPARARSYPHFPVASDTGPYIALYGSARQYWTRPGSATLPGCPGRALSVPAPFPRAKCEVAFKPMIWPCCIRIIPASSKIRSCESIMLIVLVPLGVSFFADNHGQISLLITGTTRRSFPHLIIPAFSKIREGEILKQYSIVFYFL
jgi:hypothetical protein